jgi:hypothetical protein
MSNKYLEKISGIISSIIKPVFGAAKDTMGAVGKDAFQSAHKAFGGGYRDLAVSKGITSQNTLRGISNPRSYLKAMRTEKGSDFMSAANKPQRQAEIKNLQTDRNKSIVKSVAYGGAAAIGTNKLMNSVKPQEPTYY